MAGEGGNLLAFSGDSDKIVSLEVGLMSVWGLRLRVP